MPYELKTGWDDHEGVREQLLGSLLEQLDAYAPGIRDLIIASEVRVPEDFEASHGVAGGNWHHGELSIDQSLMMRPFPDRRSTQAVSKGSIFVVQARIRVESHGPRWEKCCGRNTQAGGLVMSAAERKTMLLTTPFHSRVEQYCELNDWGAWQGYTTPNSYFDVELEYFAIRSTAGVLDLSPMNKYRIIRA